MDCQPNAQCHTMVYQAPIIFNLGPVPRWILTIDSGGCKDGMKIANDAKAWELNRALNEIVHDKFCGTK